MSENLKDDIHIEAEIGLQPFLMLDVAEIQVKGQQDILQNF